MSRIAEARHEIAVEREVGEAVEDLLRQPSTETRAQPNDVLSMFGKQLEVDARDAACAALDPGATDKADDVLVAVLTCGKQYDVDRIRKLLTEGKSLAEMMA